MNNFFVGCICLCRLQKLYLHLSKNFKTYTLRERMQVHQQYLVMRTQTGAESGTVCLVRTLCKAFAKGADENNGCHRHWKTYLRKMNVKKLLLQTFRGNRFNIIFCWEAAHTI